MGYTDELKQYVGNRLSDVLKLVGDKKEDILYKLSLCTEDEKLLMEYLYSSMPLSDIYNYDFELYYEYVKHALFLKENIPWGAKIPEDIFLNYVLHYRINNEAIEDCRRIFYDMIYQRLINKSMYEATLEVNFWCAEKVTYKSTDERTASPLALLKCGYGRCGEESTFTVTALRSVGIPARQIYTPRWAHCDDNHAWVEVWCDGEWHYLGACEPEPVLNKGWFTSAASRAMVIHSRVFSDYFRNEDVISNNKVVATINNINKYADSRFFMVKIINSRNKPVIGAEVRFEIFNYSELTSAATLYTNESGLVCINIGFGTIAVHVVKGNKSFYKIVDTKASEEIIFNIDDDIYNEDALATEDINIIPPTDRKTLTCSITKEQKAMQKKKFEYCSIAREENDKKIVEEINNAEIGNKKIGCKSKDNSEIKKILLSAMGNYTEIQEFINCSYSDLDFENRINLLMYLSKKDYIDSKCSVLNSHINNVAKNSNNYPEEIYFKYVLCPKIYSEKITDYRMFISDYFRNDIKDVFIKNPEEIWSYIGYNIEEFPQYEYEQLYTTPVNLLKNRKGSLMSKKILFVAICRTLGIPARISTTDLSIEYYNGSFINAESKYNSNGSQVIVNNKSDMELKYFQNWTMAVLRDGVYKTLKLNKDILAIDKVSIDVEPSYYRIFTSNRLPNGSIFVKKYTFEVKEGEIKYIDIDLRDVKISDMLENYDIQDFNLTDKNNNIIHASDLMKDGKNITIWIEEDMEPTEHILNEMIEIYQGFLNIKCQIIFVLRDSSAMQNKTLQKVYKLIPSIRTYFDDSSENANIIARRMYLEPDKLPLILITDKCNNTSDTINKCINVIYACSGYNVGIVELLTKIIKK